MKSKVACGDLEIGMYVVELDRPWIQAPFEPPFEVEGFTIRSEEEVEKVKDLCNWVYIDPTLGAPAKRYLTGGFQLKDISEMFGAIAPGMPGDVVYQDVTTFQEEVAPAQLILEDTQDLYLKMIDDLGHWRKPDVQAVNNVVTGLVESVIRNPEALSWLVGLKQKDQRTYTHAISVTVLALTMGRFLGLPKDRMRVLGTSALLQDVGNMALSRDLLDKPTRLSESERHTIRDHVLQSVEMLEQARDFNIEVVHTVRLHHERFDGSGYPQGLRKGEIPLLSTVNGIVDSYQAGVSIRPYRQAKTSFEVLMELYGGRDNAFPAGLIEQFIQCVGIFPIGSFVQLNTREIGVIVRRNQIQQLKPQVMILIDTMGNRIENPETVDLTAQYLEPGGKSRLIHRVVDPAKYNLNPTEFFA